MTRNPDEILDVQRHSPQPSKVFFLQRKRFLQRLGSSKQREKGHRLEYAASGAELFWKDKPAAPAITLPPIPDELRKSA